MEQTRVDQILASYTVSEHWSSRTERYVYSVELPFGLKQFGSNHLTTASGARRTWSSRRAAQAVADTFNRATAARATKEA